MKKEAESILKQLKRICASQEKCSYDIDKKLAKTNLSEKEKEDIKQELQSEKYYDDYRYVDAFIHDKLQFMKWGRKKIILNLRRKNIPIEIILPAFETINKDNYKEQLEQLLKKKKESLKNVKSIPELKAKLLRFAMTKGYEYDEVMEGIETVIEK